MNSTGHFATTKRLKARRLAQQCDATPNVATDKLDKKFNGATPKVVKHKLDKNLKGRDATPKVAKHKMDKKLKKLKQVKPSTTRKTPSSPTRTPMKASPKSSPLRASGATGMKTLKSAERNRVYSAAYHKARSIALKERRSMSIAKTLAVM